MIGLSVFKAIGDFFTNVVFAPLHGIRLGDAGWWAQNGINTIFVLVGFVYFAYWMKQSKSFFDEGTEDLPKDN